MNEHLKQALNAAVPTDPDPRDPFLRKEQNPIHQMIDPAMKIESQVADVRNDAEHQEKLRKTEALSPKGI